MGSIRRLGYSSLGIGWATAGTIVLFNTLHSWSRTNVLTTAGFLIVVGVATFILANVLGRSKDRRVR